MAAQFPASREWTSGRASAAGASSCLLRLLRLAFGSARALDAVAAVAAAASRLARTGLLLTVKVPRGDTPAALLLALAVLLRWRLPAADEGGEWPQATESIATEQERH